MTVMRILASTGASLPWRDVIVFTGQLELLKASGARPVAEHTGHHLAQLLALLVVQNATFLQNIHSRLGAQLLLQRRYALLRLRDLQRIALRIGQQCNQSLLLNPQLRLQLCVLLVPLLLVALNSLALLRAELHLRIGIAAWSRAVLSLRGH